MTAGMCSGLDDVHPPDRQAATSLTGETYEMCDGVRRHHKHSSNDPANFPTNSQTDKFLQLYSGDSLPAA